MKVQNGKRINIYLPNLLHESMKQDAKKNKHSLSSMIRELYLEKFKKENRNTNDQIRNTNITKTSL